jgi:hypothetical protein
MPDYNKMLYSIELHSLEGMRQYFNEGGSPNEVHDGVPLFTTLVEMYTRSPLFKEAVKIFSDEGLKFEDNALLAVLMDDPEKLEAIISRAPHLMDLPYSSFNNAYTPLTGGTLMHYCAEFNSINCAEILFRFGANINARAGTDEYDFGGQTPVFHTVNQNNNNSSHMLKFLIENGADLSITVRGIIWGKGYEWETWIPSVNPISYAMMGMLPQMHRKEKTVAETISLLMKRAYGIDYKPQNIPCAYLSHR